MVVEGEEGPPLDRRQGLGQVPIVVEGPLWADVAGGLVVGRVAEEEGVFAVVAPEALLPGEALEEDVGEAEVDLGELLLDPEEVERGSEGAPTTSW